jgi:hypothetical protein
MYRRMPARSGELLYLVNLALLATHQVDAAYWHEWEVFGIPGGISMFLTVNVVAVLVLAWGLGAVAAKRRGARGAAIGCAAVGLATVAIHGGFLIRDPIAFWSPPSLIVLVGILVVSGAQLVLASTIARGEA